MTSTSPDSVRETEDQRYTFLDWDGGLKAIDDVLGLQEAQISIKKSP